MAEWLYEEGIGENRAILVEGGAILEAEVELPGRIRPGAVVPARLTKTLISGRRGIATLEGGEEALVEPLPAGLSEGAPFNARILREPLPEAGNAKRARARATEEPPREAAGLAARIGGPAPLPLAGPDRFEAAGWSELLEEARTGNIAFPGGALRISLTPAMTLFDVDGTLDPAALAEAGAAAAGRAIRRLGIGGSIGIDLPTLPDRDSRRRAAEALDQALPQPFERTAVNGFGFLQIVRRRSRASLPELLRSDATGAAARALLRRAERTPGHGPLTLHAAPPVVARLEAGGDWCDALARRVGAPVALKAEPCLSIWAGHVQRQV